VSDRTSNPRPRVKAKKERTARVVSRFSNGQILVEIEDRFPRSVKLTHYYVTPLASDYGVAFRFSKFACEGGEEYHVNVGGEGEPASCDCLGHLKHGHKTTCRHVACARALIAAGKL
jgi:hypothetical protein